MDPDIVGVVSVFVRENVFDQSWTNMGPSTYWHVFPPHGNKSLCIQYDGCDIPIHECVLSVICYQLPFNKLEVSVLKHLLISPFITTFSELGIC